MFVQYASEYTVIAFPSHKLGSVYTSTNYDGYCGPRTDQRHVSKPTKQKRTLGTILTLLNFRIIKQHNITIGISQYAA